MMYLSLSKAELLSYVQAQAEHFFPDHYRLEGTDVKAAFQDSLDRTEECLKVIAYPHYHDEAGNTLFSHLHADQYATFLYFFANSLWHRSQNKLLCDKLLQMNRILFSVFISYKCNLPEHFLLAHPIGTILGNVEYHDFLAVFQGVTVNSYGKRGEPPPRLGRGLFLGAHAKIFGSEPIGDYVTIGANTTVFRQAIPSNSFAVCKNGVFTVEPRAQEHCTAQRCFNVSI